MRFSLFLAFSVGLHLLALLPAILNTTPAPTIQRALAVQIRDLPVEAPPLPAIEPMADQMSTQADELSPQPAPPSKAQSTRKFATRQTRSRLMEHLLYPQDAVNQGLEGEVMVLITLDPAGRVVSAGIARTSGHALLDTAALNAARAIGTVPGQTGELLLPVEFALD